MYDFIFVRVKQSLSMTFRKYQLQYTYFRSRTSLDHAHMVLHLAQAFPTIRSWCSHFTLLSWQDFVLPFSALFFKHLQALLIVIPYWYRSIHICIHVQSLALVALLSDFLLVPSCMRMTLCCCPLQLVVCGHFCICVTCLPTIFHSFLMLLKLSACG